MRVSQPRAGRRRADGGDWTATTAEEQCGAGENTDSACNSACNYEELLGACTMDAGNGEEMVLVFPRADSEACETSNTGCEVFAGGRSTAGPTFGGLLLGG